MLLKDIISFESKSKIKAGEASAVGNYQFFSSSEDTSKRYFEYQFDGEYLIMGTGGNATLHYFNGKFATSTDTLTIKVKNNVRTKYLYYYLLSNFHILEQGFKGAGLKHTNKNYIENIQINSFPDLKEQDFIISILNRISNTFDKKNKELELLSNLVKSRFVEMFGDPESNPFGLPIKKLSELGSLDRGRSQHRPRNAPELLDGPYPLIQTGEVSAAGLYITEYHSTYSELGLKQSRMWKAGTLCITIAANIAQTAIMTFDVCFPDSVVGFVPYNEVSALYMHYWFGFFQKILEEQAPQVAQKNINLKILSDLNVIVPEKKMLNKFESFVKQVYKSKFAILTNLFQFCKIYVWETLIF
ncbi:MAG: restriction endonuclease subunit S [Solobacterium sp.]|nr:restriction endonuclease subunit S [Solobacterium sp.]